MTAMQTRPLFRYSGVLLAVILVSACTKSSADKAAVIDAARAAKTQVPSPTGRVNDTAGVLQPTDRDKISSLLADYERETGHQAAVLIIATLADESIESFCLRAANTWRLGRKGIDDGILVCLAMKEKRIRIELGLGMARHISNADAKEIIEVDMTPSFAKGDFAGGLERGLTRLMEEGRRFTDK
jgi:uncharacterized protein